MRLGRFLLAFAFLLAQQTAFAHQIWHAAGEPEKSSQNSKLCEQHAALGAVLGALNGHQAFAAIAEPAAVHFPPAYSPADSLSSFVPASRGPPGVS